jgi:hypothetical protein
MAFPVLQGYVSLMIKPFEDALGKALRLSEQKQAIAAEMLEQLAQSEAAPYALSPDERMLVREALTRATQSGFADETEVNVTLRRPWV